jgi:hypothetical protein
MEKALIDGLTPGQRKLALVEYARSERERLLRLVAEKTSIPYDTLAENLGLVFGKGKLAETVELAGKPKGKKKG